MTGVCKSLLRPRKAAGGICFPVGKKVDHSRNRSLPVIQICCNPAEMGFADKTVLPKDLESMEGGLYM